MKTLIRIILLAVTATCAFAQNEPTHEWTVTLKVVDDTGRPVAGAETWVNYLDKHFIGMTDSNGVFNASHNDHSRQLAFQVRKTGYYSFQTQYQLGFRYEAAKWSPTVEIVLGRIINPIPMYSRRAQIEIPELDKPIGFDIMEYDWIAPYGKGKRNDITFETHRRWVSKSNFDSNTKITFSNSGDGLFVAFPEQKYSSSPHVFQPAPLDGYLPELTRKLSNTPSGGWKEMNPNLNYYLRVRTMRDGRGNVTSALYGKIYGDFTLDPINSKTTWILFTYYLNPTPNSRNVEFDANHNLFGNLPAMQQVKDP